MEPCSLRFGLSGSFKSPPDSPCNSPFFSAASSSVSVTLASVTASCDGFSVASCSMGAASSVSSEEWLGTRLVLVASHLLSSLCFTLSSSPLTFSGDFSAFFLSSLFAKLSRLFDERLDPESNFFKDSRLLEAYNWLATFRLSRLRESFVDDPIFPQSWFLVPVAEFELRRVCEVDLRLSLLLDLWELEFLFSLVRLVLDVDLKLSVFLALTDSDCGLLPFAIGSVIAATDWLLNTLPSLVSPMASLGSDLVPEIPTSVAEDLNTSNSVWLSAFSPSLGQPSVSSAFWVILSVFWATLSVFWAILSVFWAISSVFWAISSVFWAISSVFWATLSVFWMASLVFWAVSSTLISTVFWTMSSVFWVPSSATIFGTATNSISLSATDWSFTVLSPPSKASPTPWQAPPGVGPLSIISDPSELAASHAGFCSKSLDFVSPPPSCETFSPLLGRGEEKSCVSGPKSTGCSHSCKYVQ